MNKKTRALTKEEYEKVVETIEYGFVKDGCRVKSNRQIGAICVTIANTGLRIGDVLRLRLKDIIREGGRYYFNFTEQKTGKHRSFILAPEVYTYLQTYAIEHGISADSRLFQISSRGVSKHLKKVADYLGYENIGSHSLRKFFAVSIYNNNEYNIELVRTLLNHSSVAVTQHYISVSPQIVEKALLNHVYIPDIKH